MGVFEEYQDITPLFPDYYSPYYQLYTTERREEMIRTLLAAAFQQRYKNEYKSVLDSYVGMSYEEDFYKSAFAVTELSFLGMLSSYQSEEGNNYRTGEFRFATADPQVEIVLTVELSTSTKYQELRNLVGDLSRTLPEGPDLRGAQVQIDHMMLLEDRIVVFTLYHQITLTTSPKTAFSEYPLVFDGGGFLAQLFSVDTAKGCFDILYDALMKACYCTVYMPEAVREKLPSDAYKDNSYEAITNVSGSGAPDAGLLTDKEAIDVSSGTDTLINTSDSANVEDLTDTAGNSATTDQTPPTDGTDDLSSDGTDSPAASTDTDSTETDTDTPAEQTPFPWGWVAVPAGVIIFCGALAAVLLIRKKRKQS